MGSPNECLACGHKSEDHSPGDNSRCQKSHCPCLKFKPTTLEEI